MPKREFLGVLFFALSLLIGSSTLAQGDRSSNDDLSPIVDRNGQISLPTDVRATMVHIGSWYVPEGAASGFHDVYADKNAVNHYRANGIFPDGATLVKELRSATSGDYTTGSNVSFANNNIKQWFVMVKDSKNRFADTNDIWGDGWGWALFKTDDLSKNVASNYKVECLACHIPAKDNDWVYTEAYPTLVSP